MLGEARALPPTPFPTQRLKVAYRGEAEYNSLMEHRVGVEILFTLLKRVFNHFLRSVFEALKILEVICFGISI